MDTIQYKVENGIAWISLNRPKVFHSFNRDMALGLQDAMVNASNDEAVRVVVLSAEGKAFCAGQDLAEATDPTGPELSRIVREHYNPMIEKIRSCEKPVVAAVNGVAAGAGASIALACDIVVATESAAFIQAFSKIGLIPDSAGTFFLPRLVGMQKATALMMLGDKVMGKEAEELGMIYKSFSDESFRDEVAKIAGKLAKMPTKGLWLTKKALNESYDNSLTEQLALEEELQTQAGQTTDFKEGVQAFLEKRKPEFTGK
jgi:2-(1,2-epoxy-1,2-dihydrophenyl)acetyl-CoA isomerase